MNTQTTPSRLLLRPLFCSSALLFLVFALDVQAGSATWKTQPAPERDWSTPANWTPKTVPNGPTDVATFGLSDKSPNIDVAIELDELVFNPGASLFTINVEPNTFTPGSLTFSGRGITNNTGMMEAFTVFTNGYTNGTMSFMNEANAGTETSFYCYGGYNGSGPAIVQFFNTSSAGSASFTYKPGTSLQEGGTTQFFDSSTANEATFTVTGGGDLAQYNGANVFFYNSSTAATAAFIVLGGTHSSAQGGNVFLYDTATASAGVFTAQGATATDGLGGNVALFGNSTADQGTFIANPATFGTGGGIVSFQEDSIGGTARVEVFGNGHFDISAHNAPGVTIGSLEGDGQVLLGSNILTIGSSSLSTTFSGLIQGSGQLTKIGKSRLTLSGPNTYIGSTTITKGTLRVSNTSGSATGSGPLQVDGGKLGGTGIVAGETTIGPGSTAAAILEPSAGGKRAATLTIQSALHFKGGAFNCLLDTKRAQADQIVANGVSIENQDSLNAVALGNKSLTIGLVFVAINNTSGTPIGGTFGNLPDGGTLVVGRNTFQANYEGGDGNDLTLTVVQ